MLESLSHHDGWTKYTMPIFLAMTKTTSRSCYLNKDEFWDCAFASLFRFQLTQKNIPNNLQ